MCVNASLDGLVLHTILASDFLSRIIMSGYTSHIIIFSNPKCDVWMHLELIKCCVPFGVCVTLTSDLVY